MGDHDGLESVITIGWNAQFRVMKRVGGGQLQGHPRQDLGMLSTRDLSPLFALCQKNY